MSELIAEARVRVTPDTTAFRTLLVQQLAVATRGITVPVNVVPGTLSTGTAADIAAVTALRGAREEQARLREEEKRLDQERRANAKSAAEQNRQLSQLSRGAAGAALSMTGLRGATLAATGPFLAGAAAFAVFAKSVSASAQLETSLNTFQVTADATATDMERISQVARELGTDLTLPGVTAQSAAEGLAALSRAGLDVQDSIGGIRGTLQLATAAAIDNEQAVTLVANALNAFTLEGEEAGRVADLFAAASKQSQGSIVDVGLAFQQSAAAAAQAGLSLEDTIALLTQLGRAGLRGSDAGTSLRVALLRLINPAGRAKEALEGLNVSIRDQQGNVRPEVFNEITEALEGLSRAQQDATLATIFGQDAFRAAAIIGREGAAGLNEIRAATQEQGAAAELASARTKGLAGAFENLKNQASGLGLTIGDSLKTPLTDFVNIIAGGVSNINSFIGFLDSLGQEAENTGNAVEEANRKFAELVVQAGKINFAAAVRGEDAGEGLLEEQRKLNTELEETASAALKAAGSVEEYRASVAAAAGAVEGLTNRVDESNDRFARTPRTPDAASQGPVPIGPDAKLNAAIQIAASNDNLREVQRLQTIQLANARRAFENSKGNVKQRERLLLDQAAAEAALNNTRRQIAERSAADAREAATAADRAVLDRVAATRVQQENALARAQQTQGVADDIRATTQLRAVLLQQIQTVRQQVADVGARRSAVQALIAARIALAGDLTRLRAAQQAEQEANRQAIFDRREENADLRIQIAEARGNKDAVIQLLDARIRIANQALARAKKAKEGILAAILEVEELKKKRRELLKQASESDGDGGTTAFDLLTQAAERFTGGNIIGANQPFAGPTEFTADISQFLRRNQTTTTTGVGANVQQNFQGFQGGIDRLVEALNQNTQALTGGEAGPVVRKGKRPPVSGAIERNDRRWLDSKEARELIEGAG